MTAPAKRKRGRPRGTATVRYYVPLPPAVAAEVEELAVRLDRPIAWVLSQATQLGLQQVADGWQATP